MSGGRFYIHICHILFALGDITLRNFLGAYTFLNGFFNDLVIHICKIGHKIHFISLVLHITAGRIKHDHGTGVADMDKVVYGGTAYIHFDLSFLNGNEFFFFAGQGIIKFHLKHPLFPVSI